MEVRWILSYVYRSQCLVEYMEYLFSFKWSEFEQSNARLAEPVSLNANETGLHDKIEK